MWGLENQEVLHVIDIGLYVIEGYWVEKGQRWEGVIEATLNGK